MRLMPRITAGSCQGQGTTCDRQIVICQTAYLSVIVTVTPWVQFPIHARAPSVAAVAAIGALENTRHSKALQHCRQQCSLQHHQNPSEAAPSTCCKHFCMQRVKLGTVGAGFCPLAVPWDH